MKTHNKFLLLTLFSLFFLGACSPENDDIPDPTPKPDSDIVTISIPEVKVEADESKSSISFTANNTWSAKSDQRWCKLDKTSGTAGAVTINLTIEANTTNQERTAIITINTNKTSATATVKQAKNETEGGDDNGGNNGGNDGGQSGSGNGNSIDDMQNQKW